MINTKHVLSVFLLTPLREGRRPWGRRGSTQNGFLLTPLREGRHSARKQSDERCFYFYSRPCGRGDSNFPQVRHEVLRQIAER